MLQVGLRVFLCEFGERVFIAQQAFAPAFQLMQPGGLVQGYLMPGIEFLLDRQHVDGAH